MRTQIFTLITLFLSLPLSAQFIIGERPEINDYLGEYKVDHFAHNGEFTYFENEDCFLRVEQSLGRYMLKVIRNHRLFFYVDHIKPKSTSFFKGMLYDSNHNFLKEVSFTVRENKTIDFDLYETLLIRSKKVEENVSLNYHKEKANEGIAESMFLLSKYYMNLNDIETSFLWMEKAAERGHVLALYNLGANYLYGDVVAADMKKAEFFFEHSAERGFPEASCQLGHIYYQDYNGQVDYDKSFSYFSNAAEKGHFESQFMLAVHYINALGTDQDLKKCYDLLTGLSEKDYAPGQHALGIWVKTEENDPVSAIKWHILSALQGYEFAIDTVEEMLQASEKEHGFSEIYKWGDNLFNEEEYLVAAYLFGYLSEKGMTQARYMLGLCYYQPRTHIMNFPYAFEMFEKAIRNGHKEAVLYAGITAWKLSRNGRDKEKTDQAENYLKKAVETGYTDGCYHLGYLYSNREDDVDIPKAVDWYMKGISYNDPKAMYELGILYFNGEWIEQDYTKAILYITNAADSGYTKAQLVLASFYQHGRGELQKDLKTARAWYVKAMNNPQSTDSEKYNAKFGVNIIDRVIN